jgi:hypothetical protein
MEVNHGDPVIALGVRLDVRHAGVIVWPPLDPMGTYSRPKDFLPHTHVEPHAPQTQLFSIIVSSTTPLVHVLGNLTGTDASLRQASCEAWDLACLLTYIILPRCDCLCGLAAKNLILSVYSQAGLT